MFRYTKEKDKAIKLRKTGHSYSEILRKVFVAKSTLSEWFKDVGLSKRQKQKITEKRILAAKKGGLIKKKQRLERIRLINKETSKDIKFISKRELLLLGIALYWAEGSKEKSYYPGSGLQFGNSDPKMIVVFLEWLKSVGVKRDRIIFEIYIHENSKNNVKIVRKYWSKVTGFSLKNFNRVYYKKHKIKTNRKNTGDLYYGGLRVKVSNSSELVRKIAGWSDAIFKSVDNCRVV